jgi:hypothetical protein
LYAGLLGGRTLGGFLGFEAGQRVFSGAELIDPYPMELGQLGPEEGAVYAAVVGGYVAGSIGVTRAVDKYQELCHKDIEYTRPVQELENAKEFLEGSDPGETENVFEDEE